MLVASVSAPLAFSWAPTLALAETASASRIARHWIASRESQIRPPPPLGCSRRRRGSMALAQLSPPSALLRRSPCSALTLLGQLLLLLPPALSRQGWGVEPARRAVGGLVGVLVEMQGRSIQRAQQCITAPVQPVQHAQLRRRSAPQNLHLHLHLHPLYPRRPPLHTNTPKCDRNASPRSAQPRTTLRHLQPARTPRVRELLVWDSLRLRPLSPLPLLVCSTAALPQQLLVFQRQTLELVN